MEAIRKIMKVDRGKLLIDLPMNFGDEVEVIILPVRDQGLIFSHQLMKLQEETGFAKEILGCQREDVWNGV